MAKFWRRKKTDEPEDMKPKNIEVSEPDISAVALETGIEKIAYGRLWKAALAAAVLAAAANLFIYLAAAGAGIQLLVPAPSNSTQMVPMSFLSIILVGAFAAAGAALLLTFFGIPFFQGRLPRPTRILWATAIVVWFFSLAGPLGLPVNFQAKAAMFLMHTVTAAVIVIVLTLFGRQKKKR
jgi:hypothetical protein